jgi:nicotinamide phosphoribosyltransferase
LKEEIMNRDGKLVIRPDSGDPVDILCGKRWNDEQNPYDENVDAIEKGVVELLWDVFGGTINEQGYKVLDSHIGAIYGDSITIDRANEICERLEAKGFASTNVVLGIGSFTYQYNTRDTFGFAMKATYVEVNGEGREIFKDPITDDGTKKSATGLLRVTTGEDGYKLVDRQTWAGEQTGSLQTIYSDGNFYNPTTLTEIRGKLGKLVELV